MLLPFVPHHLSDSIFQAGDAAAPACTFEETSIGRIRAPGQDSCVMANTGMKQALSSILSLTEMIYRPPES